MDVTLLRWTSFLLKEELGVTFFRRRGPYLKKGGLLPHFEEVRLFLSKGVKPPHLRVILPPKGGNQTLGRTSGGASPPLIIRAKDLHSWSPRTLKDLYIRLCFLSPLFFLALS